MSSSFTRCRHNQLHLESPRHKQGRKMQKKHLPKPRSNSSSSKRRLSNKFNMSWEMAKRPPRSSEQGVFGIFSGISTSSSSITSCQRDKTFPSISPSGKGVQSKRAKELQWSCRSLVCVLWPSFVRDLRRNLSAGSYLSIPHSNSPKNACNRSKIIWCTTV